MTLILGCATLLGCAPRDLDRVKGDVRKRYPTVRQLPISDLQQWLADADREPPLLVDVRAPAEFAVSHLRGAQRGETIAEIRALVGGDASERPVVLYCSVGERSSRAARDLQREIERPVYNLEGSIFEWVIEGGSVWQGERRVERVHPYDASWGRLLPDSLRWAPVKRRSDQ